MNRLPLTVSSKLSSIDAAGEPVQLTPYANATTTAEKAPVLLAIRSATHVDADRFASLLVEEGGQGTSAQARLAVNAIASVMSGLVEKYGAITVNTPFGTVQTFIAGTVENAHDQPDSEVNYPFLAVVLPEAYRKAFASYETFVPVDACPAALKRVRNKATNEKGIRGTSPFYLEGRGMTIGGEGEMLELLNAATREKLCDVSVDAESKSPVQFQCELAPQTALEAGEYLLRLTTLAGGEATLWPVELKVELLEAVEPAPDPTYPITSDDGKFTLDEPAAVRPGADALNCTFEIVEGLAELDTSAGLAGTKLSKRRDSAEGGVACTYCNIDETFPSLLHVKFGAHDAQVGDKRYVHLTYAEGKTMVLPVTVTAEE